MPYLDFLSPLHQATRRDYLARMTEHPKAESIAVAKRYGFDYWDGERRYGFGGYRYDGRWRPMAERMAAHYDLRAGQRILDIGCGKAFLLYELGQVVPGLEVIGVDISQYAIDNAKEEVKPFLRLADASALPFDNGEFDFVFSLNTLHNLYCQDLFKALGEMERVGKKDKYLVVESYRSEQEKVNLMCWVLTGECFFHTSEWEWWFGLAGYTGDYSFIFFE
jgi:protein-L-isoaspartate(D-aspartate) O-methyltransferase